MTWCIRSLFLSPCEGRDVSTKTVCLCDWPSSKQRCIDATASPLAPRPVLTSALLGGFVQPEWLQRLAEIYSAVRETGLSKGDGLACKQRVEGSDPRGRVCEHLESCFIWRCGLFTGRIMNACSHATKLAVRVETGWQRLCRDVGFSCIRHGTRKYPSKVKGSTDGKSPSWCGNYRGQENECPNFWCNSLIREKNVIHCRTKCWVQWHHKWWKLGWFQRSSRILEIKDVCPEAFKAGQPAVHLKKSVIL